MPKAPAFPDDEKTTIESGWEEEASTTIEQGELAEKLRATGLEPPRRNGVGNITSTGNSVVDEPTVDDQRAHAAIAMITPPSLAAARIVVTQGNDAGQHLEVIPGKTYTIGRAIDNDFVLTDIAVSRKHFDLRQEDGAWIVVDRGSGNGTLVNGNLEDQPFVLANGDLIEIGNTTFRFEQANAPPRAQRPVPIAGRYDVEVDEEEPSTVAGKPLRGSHEEMATPAQMPAPHARL
ncbi:MAG TPA: FHA domain-containing protein, partial [Kofleriaceae bacterium]|nr:FHA domain-containing protein [Kofleriaceae bacterium]